MEKLKVTVIMPSYNHAKFLESAIESVLQQSLEEFEFMIIDDGSSDGSLDIIKKYEKLDNRIRWISQQNAGAHNAINNGCRLAKGKYISIINSDDIYSNSRLETLYSNLEETGAILAFSNVEIVDESGIKSRCQYAKMLSDMLSIVPEYKNISYALLKSNVAISTGNLFFLRNLFHFIGGFSDLKLCHDWKFVLSSLKFNLPVYVEEKLYKYRIHKLNSFHKLNKLALIETKESLNEIVLAMKENRPNYLGFPCANTHGDYFYSFFENNLYPLGFKLD